jgi:catechol 2,3-dioxygenase-like lactoylglutathione lyase family enzyme
MAMIAQISLGVDDPDRAGAFWIRALGYVRRPPRWPGDDWIVIEPPAGVAGAAIAMDTSGSPAEEFPRVHLDLRDESGDLDAEVDRLLRLGARRVDWPHYPGPGERHPDEPPYVVLADPEGNRFCVAAVARSGQRRSPGCPAR